MPANADAYDRLLTQDIAPAILARGVDGLRELRVLRRSPQELDPAGGSEFLTAMTFTDFTAVSAFTGERFLRPQLSRLLPVTCSRASTCTPGTISAVRCSAIVMDSHQASCIFTTWDQSRWVLWWVHRVVARSLARPATARMVSGRASRRPVKRCRVRHHFIAAMACSTGMRCEDWALRAAS